MGSSVATIVCRKKTAADSQKEAYLRPLGIAPGPFALKAGRTQKVQASETNDRFGQSVRAVIGVRPHGQDQPHSEKCNQPSERKLTEMEQSCYCGAAAPFRIVMRRSFGHRRLVIWLMSPSSYY